MDFGGSTHSSLFVTSEGGKGIASLRQSAFVRIGPGLTLAFKRRFKEYWLDDARCGSFTSRHMVPDVSLVAEADAGRVGKLLVLDAKYRIEEQLNDAISRSAYISGRDRARETAREVEDSASGGWKCPYILTAVRPFHTRWRTGGLWICPAVCFIQDIGLPFDSVRSLSDRA